MPATAEIVPAERIQSRIVVLRGQRVLLDADIAKLYGVPTKQLNQAIKRNSDKFPEEFMFVLNAAEKTEVVTKCDHLKKLKFSHQLPYAFTEHGAIQAANVLNSKEANEMSVRIIRAFVGLRQLMVNHKALSSKLAELDARVGAHDEQLAAIVEAIRQLAEPVAPRNRLKIGFHSGNC